ncbi:MAG: prepilin peptidase [archaeon]
MILISENIFLIVLGVVWIIGAILQDLRRREVDNVWNFSLIAIALGYRLSMGIFIGDYWFFTNGLIGFGIFLVLGNLFYYSRMFAGGDAKLLIALGAILPLSFSWIINFKIFGLFILGSFLGGAIYVFIWSLVLVFLNFKGFKKEYSRLFNKHKSLFLMSLILFVFWIIFSFVVGSSFAFIGLIFLLFPILFVFAKSVENSCMVKKVSPFKLTEGDWLYEKIYIKGKVIKPNWEGVSKEELKLIREKYRRKILVKYGVPFTPAFLIGFLGVLGISLWLGWI